MIWALIVGLFVGTVSKTLIPGRDPGGTIINSLIGIVGAMLAHWAGISAGWYLEGDPAGFLASMVGAMFLLLVYGVIRNPRSHS